jgi:hypothetical protein
MLTVIVAPLAAIGSTKSSTTATGLDGAAGRVGEIKNRLSSVLQAACDQARDAHAKLEDELYLAGLRALASLGHEESIAAE